ncbi:MAG: 50S ribosomal protein L22 [Thermoguttaceae bacterium]|nr:50S ribosomal protein L22 [Thermoguttaceae bacterium]
MEKETERLFYTAKHRFATISPQKVRPFADLIRGKDANVAMEILRCYPNRGARFLEKVLKSAIHNAEDLSSTGTDGLTVLEVRVDNGPMFKRWKAGSRGVSTIVKKRLSHIMVSVG